MSNEMKKVKDVFKDYEAKGNILDCDIVDVSILKKSNKLIIKLKSENKIQIGEKLAFEFYLKSKFRVQEAEVKLECIVPIKAEKSSKNSKESENSEKSEIIIGSKRAKINDKIVKVKDINMDSGRVVICGEIIKQEIKELKSGKFLVLMNVYDRELYNNL